MAAEPPRLSTLVSEKYPPLITGLSGWTNVEKNEICTEPTSRIAPKCIDVYFYIDHDIPLLNLVNTNMCTKQREINSSVHWMLARFNRFSFCSYVIPRVYLETMAERRLKDVCEIMDIAKIGHWRCSDKQTGSCRGSAHKVCSSPHFFPVYLCSKTAFGARGVNFTPTMGYDNNDTTKTTWGARGSRGKLARAQTVPGLCVKPRVRGVK